MDTSLLWQLLDTGFKVGLGALIAGFFCWLLSLRQAAQVQAPANRRLELLEEVSKAVGRINHIFAKYAALAIESTRYGTSWPQFRRDELDRVNLELVAEFKKLAEAEAQLLMLGEKTLEKTLRLYEGQIAYFRKHVYMGRQDISDEEISKIKQSMSQLRDQFYDVLSRKYDRLLVGNG